MTNKGMNLIFANNLKNEMYKANVKATDVSRIAGVGKSTVSEWHSRGQEFDPPYIHQYMNLEITTISRFFYYLKLSVNLINTHSKTTLAHMKV